MVKSHPFAEAVEGILETLAHLFCDLSFKKKICAAYSCSFLVRITAKTIREALVQSSSVTVLFTTRNRASIHDTGHL